MQWARGFFRLWIILTALLIVFAGSNYNVSNAVHVLAWRDYGESLCSDPAVLMAVNDWKVSLNAEVVSSATKFEDDCFKYKSVDQASATKIRNGRDWEQYLANEDNKVDAAKLAASVNHIALKFNYKLKYEKQKAWDDLQRFANDTMVPAILVLVFGAGLTWALRGFSARKT